MKFNKNIQKSVYLIPYLVIFKLITNIMNRPLTQLFFRRVSVVNFLEFARKIIYSTCLVFTWDDGSGKAKISKVRLLVAICLSLLSKLVYIRLN
jgi:hypothetical protein